MQPRWHSETARPGPGGPTPVPRPSFPLADVACERPSAKFRERRAGRIGRGPPRSASRRQTLPPRRSPTTRQASIRRLRHLPGARGHASAPTPEATSVVGTLTLRQLSGPRSAPRSQYPGTASFPTMARFAHLTPPNPASTPIERAEGVADCRGGHGLTQRASASSKDPVKFLVRWHDSGTSVPLTG